MNILMTQIGTLGDCLLTTAIARQIKELDYPGCHLTWLIGEYSDLVLRNNPHVDEVIVLPIAYVASEIIQARINIHSYIDALKTEGRDFDKIFIFDNNSFPQTNFYYGDFRSIYFRIYHELYNQHPIVAPEPVIVLGSDEVENVKRFMEKYNLNKNRDYLILFESNPHSNQSTTNPEMAFRVAQKLICKFSNVKCILSGKTPLQLNQEKIIDACEISYRENAELLNQCHLLVGSNSGITWLNASTWSKKIPMIQNINTTNNSSISYSVEMDYKNVGTQTDKLIELQDADELELFECISEIVSSSFTEAKKRYPEKYIYPTDYYARYYSIFKLGFNVFASDIHVSVCHKNQSESTINPKGSELRYPLAAVMRFTLVKKLARFIFHSLPQSLQKDLMHFFIKEK